MARLKYGLEDPPALATSEMLGWNYLVGGYMQLTLRYLLAHKARFPNPLTMVRLPTVQWSRYCL